MGEFEKRMQELRKECNYTQEELAKLLKTTRSAISMYEQGKRKPDLEMQEAIADLFNVDMDYLIGRNNKKRGINEKALSLYYKYLNADKKTKNIIDQLLEEGD